MQNSSHIQKKKNNENLNEFSVFAQLWQYTFSEIEMKYNFMENQSILHRRIEYLTN